MKLYFNKRSFKRCIIFTFIFLFTIAVLRFKVIFNNSFDTDKNNIQLNFEQIDYIIQNEICNSPIFLLILIHSAPNHFHLRNLIRSTWGQPDADIVNIKAVFLLAAAPELQADIEKENNRNRDIIQWNFTDSYRNLTYKHAMGLRWATENCAKAKYLMKMDDDIFMDIYQFVEYINSQFTPSELSNKIACFLQSGMPVVRDPVSKWYVSKYEYSSDIYENYCSGWAYITTTQTADVLVQKVSQLSYFWIDDVHVTGTAAKAANISYIRINQLFDLESDGLADWSNNSVNLNWNKIFAPTWGDLALSRRGYRKTVMCFIKRCKCCYVKETTTQQIEPLTARKGVAEVLSIF